MSQSDDYKRGYSAGYQAGYYAGSRKVAASVSRAAQTEPRVYSGPSERAELYWLARQATPVWGGPLMRGESIRDPQMLHWIKGGIIEQWTVGPVLGFRLSDRGREYLASLAPASSENAP